MIYTICDFFNTLSIFEQLHFTKKCAKVVRSQQTFAHFFVSKRSFLDAPTFLFYNKL